ncbi:hypothetical protein HOY80DRAFT_1011558 [Tuber brumale]|nr:hypothetical protein HOY80DRAFT_1011558 [Tuber brumale]
MPAFGGPVGSDPDPSLPTVASMPREVPATQTEDTSGWHPGETSPPSNGRNRPGEEAITATIAAPTEFPIITATESDIPANPASRVSTATFVGILVALGVVSIAALIALACIKRKKRRSRRSPIDGGDDEAEKAPPSYEAAVFGSTDNATWNEHYGINNPPQQQPEQPILQSPEPVHHVIHSPRPISAASSTALNHLEPVITPQQRPVSQEIAVFPHDSPVLGPQDDNISLQTALRLSQQNNRVLYSQPTASGRFTENFDDSASVVSELTEEERIVAAEIV